MGMWSVNRPATLIGHEIYFGEHLGLCVALELLNAYLMNPMCRSDCAGASGGGTAEFFRMIVRNGVICLGCERAQETPYFGSRRADKIFQGFGRMPLNDGSSVENGVRLLWEDDFIMIDWYCLALNLYDLHLKIALLTSQKARRAEG